MATKQPKQPKQTKQTTTTTTTTTATAVGNPFAALAAPAAPAPLTGVRAAAAKILASLPVGAVNSVGVALQAVAPSIAAKGQKCTWPVTVAPGTSYMLGAKLTIPGQTPCKGKHDVPCSLSVQALGATFTAAQAQAAGIPWHSMAAYLKRGYVLAV